MSKENENNFIADLDEEETLKISNGLSEEEKSTQNNEIMAASSKHPIHKEIKKYKSTAVLDLTNSWLNPLEQLREQLKHQIDQKIDKKTAFEQAKTINAVLDAKEETIRAIQTESNRILDSQRLESNRILDSHKSEILILKKKLDSQSTILKSLDDERIRREFLEKRRVENAFRRRNRTPKPLRDAASFPELKAVLDHIDSDVTYKSAFARSRDRIALLLLFFTGLRISNLRLITSNHLSVLLDPDAESRRLDVVLVKTRKPKQISFPIATIHHRMCFEFEEDIELLQKGKEGEDLVFTAEGEFVGLDRSWLTKRINKLLEAASKKYHKKITSHSFRIGHINALIEEFGIEGAQRMIDHESISTTSRYSRKFHD